MSPARSMPSLAHLPDDVRARARVLAESPLAAPRGTYVLYWMRIAVRDHENPALDAAIASANALGVPVLVYHAVSERYPYASDRHHTFILEGARDVALGLRRREVAYALHVERPGARGPHLRTLAEGAALVVTEEAPMPPLSSWTARLAAHLREKGVPLWTIDASCIVPMPRVERRYDRAYAFRSASRRLAAASLAHAWHDAVPAQAPSIPALPFEPIDAESLDDRAIARLVAECEIDHGVGPVRELRGGSVAGYARWDLFKAEGLARYAARRNDAAIDGTSRLSPWLHYGHVSPLRIAREASEARGAGADKFLDELLVWREVAWHFAAHTPDLETLDVLPDWARATLDAHAGDPREVISRERLERGLTGDELWDLAQRSLVAHGELHNNVRMTWGKAIPGWTASPEEARKALVALNHRFALDGRDPSSYGGLYWCLGLFDRPFSPERPVLGAVRGRPTAVHAERLDLEAYAARARRPTRRLGKVAVIGAGLAGLACARTLVDHDVDVVLFDKGRAPGGRLASRRTPDLSVDLGAQYFTARDPRFARFVASWLDDGVVARWSGRIHSVAGRSDGEVSVETPPVERLVGTPSMSAVARHLARGLVIHASHRVDRITKGGSYVLYGARAPEGTTLGPRDAASQEPLEELGAFDALVVCLPPNQARDLLEGVSPAIARDIADVAFEPCVAMGFVPEGDALAAMPFDGLFVGRDGDPDRIVAWLARDSSKPARPEGDAWVVHADGAWSRSRLRDASEALESALLEEIARVLGLPSLRAKHRALQRWAFACAPSPRSRPLFDDDARLGVGGDWTSGGRVEGAFLSGVALAGRVLGS
ncbi:MAG: FAD-dependent oxidoreductase [Deltaproteobacteria bacterium]|nr:FAD-dependent oxidoreductase [Deltaproteobacteria bacterium]